MKKVTLRGRITFNHENLNAAVEALPAHIAATRAEAGCLVFEVSPCSDDPMSFEVYEAF